MPGDSPALLAPERNRRCHFLPAMLVLLCLWVPERPAHGTTLEEMHFDALVDQAELVFEGLVIGRQSQQEGAGEISTYVTFRILEVIKGDYPGETIELKFMGGEVNGQVMEVSGMRQPRNGERGIYFVESTTENLINPLLGWSQGHFLVDQDSAGLQVLTPAGDPVLEVLSAAGVPAAIRRPPDLLDGAGITASGVVVDDRPGIRSRGLDPQKFKSRIRELMQPNPER